MEAQEKRIIKQQVVYIPTHDLARAQLFYAKVFKFNVSSYSTVEDPTGERWSLFPLARPDERGRFVPTDFFFIGLGHSPHLVPSETGTIPFLPCDDMDETLEVVEASGGTVRERKLMERQTAIARNQLVDLYYAFFIDTEGNKIGLSYGEVTTIPYGKKL